MNDKKENFPEWWFKYMEEKYGKDDPYVQFVRRHDRFPSIEELGPMGGQRILFDRLEAAGAEGREVFDLIFKELKKGEK